MELVILGCGTSTGVPIVGCRCNVCKSDNPRNSRMRSSAFIALDSGENILIDTSPDLRSQGLANNLTHVDAVFYTHTHADHIHGIDELRIYNYLQQKSIDIYGAKEHLDYIRKGFSYIFEPSIQRGGGKPSVITHEIVPGETFKLFEVEITPIELYHGKLLCIGWRIGDLAYLTDISTVEPAAYSHLEDLKLLILDALRYVPHETHLTIDQASEIAQKINPERCILTHMGHEVDYDQAMETTPDFIEPAYDGMRIKI